MNPEVFPGFVRGYFFRTMFSVTVPSAINFRIPSAFFAFTARLMNAFTFSIPDSASNSEISLTDRLTKFWNLRGVDFAIWIESIFCACVRNCCASTARNFGVAVAVGVDVDGVDGVVFRAIFCTVRFRDNVPRRFGNELIIPKTGYPTVLNAG